MDSGGSGVEITGTVKDALSRPIEGAAISLQSASGKVLAVTSSDKTGRFEFHKVPDGTYAIDAHQAALRTQSLS